MDEQLLEAIHALCMKLFFRYRWEYERRRARERVEDEEQQK